MAGESRKARITRMHRQYETLCEFIPTVKCQLDFHTPFELLVATILSAQTTDKRVNSITPELFGTYPTAAALADARLEDVESIIRPLGFYHVKAEHIIAVARQIVERFGGQIPQTMEELTSLPGVGRKTANVVLGNAFRVPGFPVDTHVIRVTGRLHWRDDWMKTSTTPERIEQEITGCFPESEWTDLSHRLIIFGRNICTSRSPECENCPLLPTCPSAGEFLEIAAERKARATRRTLWGWMTSALAGSTSRSRSQSASAPCSSANAMHSSRTGFPTCSPAGNS